MKRPWFTVSILRYGVRVAWVSEPDAGGVYGEGYHVDELGRVIARSPTEPFGGVRSPGPRSEWRLWTRWIRHALRGR